MDSGNPQKTTHLKVLEIKSFVPAKVYALSKQFYLDLGFTLASDTSGIAYFRQGDASFLLQDFYVESHASNFMMHLLVDDVDAWWQRIVHSGVPAKYGVQIEPPQERPWGMRDFALRDPSGVLWRIAQNMPAKPASIDVALPASGTADTCQPMSARPA